MSKEFWHIQEHKRFGDPLMVIFAGVMLAWLIAGIMSHPNLYASSVFWDVVYNASQTLMIAVGCPFVVLKMVDNYEWKRKKAHGGIKLF